MAEITKPTGLNKIWALGGAVIVPDDSKINRGWIVEAPAHQIENYLNRKHDQAFAHLNQHGFFEWSPEGTEYIANKSWVMGSNGWIYNCRATHTSPVNPVTDASQSYWRPILNGQALVTSPEISAFMRHVLTAPAGEIARQRLGMTSLGISVTNASTGEAMRFIMGFSILGNQLVTASSPASARSSLGFSSLGNSLATAESVTAARVALMLGPATEGMQGLVAKATDAEAIAGTDDGKYLTPRKLKLGFSVGSDHIHLPSWLGGRMFRWGTVNMGANTSQVVTYFPTACLTGQATISGVSLDGSGGAFVSKNGVQFVVTNPENSPRTVEWFAIGY